MTGDAEWMVGKSRKHLAPDLDRGFLMDGTYFVFQLSQPFSCIGDFQIVSK